LALGASRARVVGLVLRDVIIVAAMGIGGGLIFGVGLSRFVVPLLYETHPSDTTALAAPIAWLVLATALSAAPSTLRVVCIKPAESLRHE
jgi:ABC-type antimicrobial peptide transport system permease subunit